MQTYIAILRGINVSGHKIIKMAELSRHLASLGLSYLTTYIQSGNIVFQTEALENSILEEKIHQNIKENYGFDVPVIVRSKQEWQLIVNQFPFNVEDYDVKRLAITFLKEKPVHIPIEELEKYKASSDEIIYHRKEIYLSIPDGFGISKITNTVFERKLKVAATTRNWRTTLKLMEMANQLPISTKGAQ